LEPHTLKLKKNFVYITCIVMKMS